MKNTELRNLVIDAYFNSIFPNHFTSNFSTDEFINSIEIEETEEVSDTINSVIDEINDPRFLKSYCYENLEDVARLAPEDVDPTSELENVIAKIYKCSESFYYAILDTSDVDTEQVFETIASAQKWITDTVFEEVENYKIQQEDEKNDYEYSQLDI